MAGATASNARILPPPNFQELLVSVSLQSWIPPSMPGQVAALGGFTPGATGGGAQPPTVPSPNPAPSPAPAPSPPLGPATGGATLAQQYEVRNNNILPDLAAAMNGCNFQLRTLFGRRRPLQHADGRPMCCTYHLRGRCSNTCSCVYSHCTLIASEQETLRTFVNDRIVTPNIGRDEASSGALGVNTS